jgi:hypothetical protein
MAIARTPRWSLRLEQAEFSRLTWAFILSLALHALIFATYHTGQKYHLWQRLHWPTWLRPPQILAQLVTPKPKPPPLVLREPPLIFVNVSPAQAVAEPPKDAKYYSDKNSVAANPQADQITEVPKIEGTQDQVPKTEEVPRDKFVPLQPTPPPPKPQEAQIEQKPKPAYTPGDLTLAKPAPTPRPDEGTANEAKPERPRTIKEARARLEQNRLPGEKMQQDGGVQRRRESASLDTKATPFGAYDAALVEAICQRWYSLLDAREYASDSRGKVVLQFRLHPDGRVSDMNVSVNTAGEVLGLICQKAVLDPSPFAAWPSDMRRTLGDMRNIQFTFYYN